MSISSRFGVAAAAVLGTGLIAYAVAQAPAAKAPAASAGPAAPAPVAKAPAKPAASPAALMQTILGAEEAVERSGLKYPQSLQWLVKTIVKAADQVAVHPQATPEQKQEAIEYKIGVLIQAAQYKADEFEAPCRKFCEELAKSQPKTIAGSLAATFPFVLDVMNADPVPTDADAKLVKLAAAYPASPILPQIFAQLSAGLKEEGKTEQAVQLLKQGIAIFEKTKEVDPEAIAALHASLTRLTLVGSQVEFSAPTLAGSTLDMKSLAGKVVLIDFWATWCGPCVAELPNVKAAYEKYHSRGFEIVAVSLDDDKAELQAFVKERGLPWTQIIFENEQDRGWESPLAKKFSVKSLPTMFLVGADGKLITDELRGEGVLDKAVADALESAEVLKTAAKPDAASAQ